MKAEHMNTYPLLLAQFLLLVSSESSLANVMPVDGLPANGIQVRNERNIRIEKETLLIRRDKIEVTYVYRNLSQKEITTEVAFPIPAHTYDATGIIKYPVHGDFKIEVDGKRVRHNEITKATIGNKDVTAILDSFNISIKDFDAPRRGSRYFGDYFRTLSRERRDALIEHGLVTTDTGTPPDGDWFYAPAWSVGSTYHWTQRFPADQITVVTLSYRPNASNYAVPQVAYPHISYKYGKRGGEQQDWARLLCLSPETAAWAKVRGYGFNTYSVDYILTTAKFWKMPIGEFRLIIEARPSHPEERVSTCFEHSRLRRISDTRYEMTIKDFVPDKEIAVFIIDADFSRWD